MKNVKFSWFKEEQPLPGKRVLPFLSAEDELLQLSVVRTDAYSFDLFITEHELRPRNGISSSTALLLKIATTT